MWKHVLVGMTLLCAAVAGGCAAPESEAMMERGIGSDPLQGAKIMAFGVAKDAEACRAFYSGKLGLRVLHEDTMAIVFDSGGTIVRIQKAATHEPRPYTVLGWQVTDMRATVKRFVASGITLERYDWMTFQDGDGVAKFPNGDMVAWFKDPDGNVLSVAQLVR